MEKTNHRRLFLLVADWTWWAWTATAVLLALGLGGVPGSFETAIALSAAQTAAMLVRDRRVSAFPVQLRLAYTLFLLVCYPPRMHWLYWVPAVGTFALVIFGYCLMARVLSLLPWNRRERLSFDLLRRTFLSAPRLPSVPVTHGRFACAGGLCTIEAQVAKREQNTSQSSATSGRPRGREDQVVETGTKT
jgi:hypothetical protein